MSPFAALLLASPGVAFAADPTGDGDGDGFTDFEEGVIGSDPDNPWSQPEVLLADGMGADTAFAPYAPWPEVTFGTAVQPDGTVGPVLEGTGEIWFRGAYLGVADAAFQPAPGRGLLVSVAYFRQSGDETWPALSLADDAFDARGNTGFGCLLKPNDGQGPGFRTLRYQDGAVLGAGDFGATPTPYGTWVDLMVYVDDAGWRCIAADATSVYLDVSVAYPNAAVPDTVIVADFDVQGDAVPLLMDDAWVLAAPVDDDSDGASDHLDNCAGVANPTQADLDEDGLGDACDPFQDLAPILARQVDHSAARLRGVPGGAGLVHILEAVLAKADAGRLDQARAQLDAYASALAAKGRTLSAADAAALEDDLATMRTLLDRM